MKKQYIALTAMAIMVVGFSGNAFAWGINNGVQTTCDSIAPPTLGGGGWNLFLRGSDLCSWSKTVNDTKMGGYPGQYFCTITANLNRNKPWPCWGAMRLSFTGSGIYGGKQACTDLFGPNAHDTVFTGYRHVCNNH